MRAGAFAGGCAAVAMIAAACSGGATGGVVTTTSSGDSVPSASAIVASTSTIATTTTVSEPLIETEPDALALLATRAAFTVDQMDAIAAVLGAPTPSNAQILVAVSTRPVAPRLQLASLRDEVLTELYGDGADLMKSLMADWLAWAHQGKDYGHDAVSFAAEVDLPDDGERTSLDLKAIRGSDSNEGWLVIDGSWLHAVGYEPLYTPVGSPSVGSVVVTDRDGVSAVLGGPASGSIVSPDDAEIHPATGQPFGEASAAGVVGATSDGRLLLTSGGYNPCFGESETSTGPSGVFISTIGGEPELLWDSGGRASPAWLWLS